MIINAKLALPVALLAGVVFYLAFLGYSTTWQYYMLVDECEPQVSQFQGKRLRVSGRVASKSLQISADRRTASFVLCGDKHEMPVRCSGPLPDNLTDCMEVVVEGVLQGDGHLRGQRVITRCASKYAPQQRPASPDS